MTGNVAEKIEEKPTSLNIYNLKCIKSFVVVLKVDSTFWLILTSVRTEFPWFSIQRRIGKKQQHQCILICKFEWYLIFFLEIVTMIKCVENIARRANRLNVFIFYFFFVLVCLCVFNIESEIIKNHFWELTHFVRSNAYWWQNGKSNTDSELCLIQIELKLYRTEVKHWAFSSFANKCFCQANKVKVCSTSSTICACIFSK